MAMKGRERTTGMRTKLVGALLLLLPVVALCAGEIRFAVPSGSLGTALGALAEQADLQLVYNGDLVKDLKTVGLNGTLLPEAALQKLLEGTGLVFRFTSRNTVYIEKPRQTNDTRVLGPVRVEGAGNAGTYYGRSRYPDGTIWWFVGLYQLRDGRIGRSTIFFAQEFEAPEWRAPYVTRG